MKPKRTREGSHVHQDLSETYACTVCGKNKPLSEYYQSDNSLGHMKKCISCKKKVDAVWRKKNGYTPLSESGYTTAHLGAMAKDLASELMPGAVRVEMNYRGYDYFWKAMKIKVKSSTLHTSVGQKNPFWRFSLPKNDYETDEYLMMGLDSYNAMNIKYAWMVPRDKVSGTMKIYDTSTSLEKWRMYEVSRLRSLLYP